MEQKRMEALSDKDLVNAVGETLRRERESVTFSLHLLGEIVRRDLHARLGYPSVYAMLTKRFGLAESCASKRAAAAAVVRRFPAVMTLIENGTIHLSNLSMIARHIGPDNKDELIEAASRMTHRELEEFLVRRGGAGVSRRESLRVVALTSRVPEARVQKQPTASVSMETNIKPVSAPADDGSHGTSTPVVPSQAPRLPLMPSRPPPLKPACDCP